MDNVKIDFSDLTKIGVKLKNLKERFLKNSNIAAKIASNARNIITERTRKGLNIKLRSFPSYSSHPYYREKSLRPKAKGGRRRGIKTKKAMQTIFYEGGYREFAAKTKGSTTVTLHATGDMFRAFQVNPMSWDVATIAFHRISAMMKALGVTEQKGKFIGLHKREKEILERHAGKMIDNMLKSLGLK